MKVIASALLLAVVALAEMPAYSGMMEDNMTAMLTGGDKHLVSGRGTIQKDARGNIVHAKAGFSVGNPTDGSGHVVLEWDSTPGLGNSTRIQFLGTSEFLIPAGMDSHQSNSTFGAGPGFRLVCL